MSFGGTENWEEENGGKGTPFIFNGSGRGAAQGQGPPRQTQNFSGNGGGAGRGRSRPPGKMQRTRDHDGTGHQQSAVFYGRGYRQQNGPSSGDRRPGGNHRSSSTVQEQNWQEKSESMHDHFDPQAQGLQIIVPNKCVGRVIGE